MADSDMKATATTKVSFGSKIKSTAKEFNPLQSNLTIKQKIGIGAAGVVSVAVGVVTDKIATKLFGGVKKPVVKEVGKN